MQMFDSQVSVPQHWEELVQGELLGVQPPAPVQTPLLQVSVPQQSEEREQFVPWPEQLMPSEQTRLLLQVSMPQQSPELLQTWSRLWQGPVPLTSGTEMSSCGQPHKRNGRSSMARRGARRVMGLV